MATFFRYGEEAGSLAENTVSATSNLIVTSQNVGSLGKAAVAKQVAKKTGKIVIDDLSSDVDKENLFVVVETSVDDKQKETRFKTSGSEVWHPVDTDDNIVVFQMKTSAEYLLSI